MTLSPEQKAEILTWLNANANGQSHQVAANMLNAAVNPDHWAWSTAIKRVDVYTGTPTEGTTWSWQGFKAQGVSEQNCWFEMFMGGTCNFSKLSNRVGAEAIFGTSGLSGANRVHIFNVVRRKVTVLEKIFTTAITGAPVNTGNDNQVGNQGKTTNPHAMGAVEGLITEQQVSDIRGGV